MWCEGSSLDATRDARAFRADSHGFSAASQQAITVPCDLDGLDWAALMGRAAHASAATSSARSRAHGAPLRLSPCLPGHSVSPRTPFPTGSSLICSGEFTLSRTVMVCVATPVPSRHRIRRKSHPVPIKVLDLAVLLQPGARPQQRVHHLAATLDARRDEFLVTPLLMAVGLDPPMRSTA